MKSERMSFALYAIGIVLAIVGSAQLPAPDQQWPESWPMFAVGVAVAALGLVWWRSTIKAEAKQGQLAGRSAEELFALLVQARDMGRAIQADFDGLDSQSIRARIDQLLDATLLPFVEDRQVLVETYGMKTGADIVLKESAAERNFNRVWSAAADDHLPEARTSLQAALATMDELVDEIQPLMKAE